MPRICSVVFRGGGRVYQFAAGDLELAPGDGVVVDTTRGNDFGRVVKAPAEVAADDAPRGLRRVVRRATAADVEAIASHRETERQAKRKTEAEALARTWDKCNRTITQCQTTKPLGEKAALAGWCKSWSVPY